MNTETLPQEINEQLEKLIKTAEQRRAELRQLRERVDKLRTENTELRRENSELNTQMAKLRQKMAEALSIEEEQTQTSAHPLKQDSFSSSDTPISETPKKEENSGSNDYNPADSSSSSVSTEFSAFHVQRNTDYTSE